MAPYRPVVKPKPAAPATLPDGSRTPFMVTNVKPRLIEIAGLRIAPLETVEIPPEHEDGVRDSSPFRARYLVEGTPVLPESRALDLSKFSEEQAIKLVEIETDLNVLAGWADTEKRPAIVAALQTRASQL